jgi:hypothetical protein
VARVLNALASRHFSSSGNFWASVICVFLFVHPCFYSQFIFINDYKLFGILGGL